MQTYFSVLMKALSVNNWLKKRIIVMEISIFNLYWNLWKLILKKC